MDLFGAKVDASGALGPVDPLVALGEDAEVAAMGNGKYLLAYSRFDPTPGIYTWRAYTRVISYDPLPAGSPSSFTTSEDTPVAVTLARSSGDDGTLSFAVKTLPANGTLAGFPPNLHYTPSPNFNGEDAFTFVVRDAYDETYPATVSITVTPVNDPPVARNASYELDEDGSLAITLEAVDVDGDDLTFRIMTPPAHGELSGTPPELIYTLHADFNGTDRFEFAVSDGTLEAQGGISLTVHPVNDAPIAEAQSVQTTENAALAITLAGVDVDGDALTFQVVSGPEHGSLSGTAPALVYEPNPQFHGEDAFTFVVSDGVLESAPATVSITVTAVNDAPVAESQSVELREDETLAITLAGFDVDGDSLTFVVKTEPENGTLTGTAPALIYTPNPDFHGVDAFSFAVSDGQAESAPATVGITVHPVNDAPIALAQSVTVAEEASVAITLEGTDLEGDTLVFAVTTLPANGALTGTAPNLTYAPNPGFSGSDAFEFVVSDASATSQPAMVSITVTAEPIDPGVVGEVETGCGCSSASGAAASPMLWFGALALLARRRVR